MKYYLIPIISEEILKESKKYLYFLFYLNLIFLRILLIFVLTKCIAFPNIDIRDSTYLFAPHNLKISTYDNNAFLTWDKNINATSYNIYRSQDKDLKNIKNNLIANKIESLSYNDYGLQNGETYYYSITSLLNDFESDESSRTPILTVPKAPTNFKSYNDYLLIKLSWDSVEGAEKYKVFKNSNNIIDTKLATPNFITKNNFLEDNYKRYGEVNYYTVVSNNESGDSILTSNTIMQGTPPPPPININIVLNNNIIDITWDTLQNIDGYNIYRFNNPSNELLTSNKINSIVLTSNNFQDSNLIKGQKYYYYLSTLNKYGESPSSHVYYKQLEPIAPSLVYANISVNNINLLWDPSFGNNLYKIFRTTNPIINLLNSTTPTYTSISNNFNDISFSRGEVYYYTIISSNDGGNSHNISPSFRVETFPATPTNLTYILNNTIASLNWLSSKGAISYNIYRSKTYPVLPIASNKINNSSVINNPFIDSNLLNNVTYHYVVTASNLSGESEVSNSITVLPQPTQPTMIVSSTSGTNIILSWANNSVSLYKIYRSSTPQIGTNLGTLIGTTTSTSYTDTTNVSPYIYFYKVVANNGLDSTPSLEISAQTPVSIPTNVKINNSLLLTGQTKLDLSWDSVNQATSYDIYWGTNSYFLPNSTNKFSTNNNSFTLNSISNGTRLYFKFVAISNLLISNISNTYEILLRPEAPVLSITDNNLFWNPITSSTNFIIYRSTDINFGTDLVTFTIAGNSTSFIDKNYNINNNASFYYKIAALNNTGLSKESNVIFYNYVPISINPTIFWASTKTIKSFNVNLISSRPWSTTNNNTWVSLNKVSGTSNDVINITLNANTYVLPRTGSVQFFTTDKVVEVEIYQFPTTKYSTVAGFFEAINIPSYVTTLWVSIVGGTGGKGGNGASSTPACGYGNTNGLIGGTGTMLICSIVLPPNTRISYTIGDSGADGSSGISTNIGIGGGSTTFSGNPGGNASAVPAFTNCGANKTKTGGGGGGAGGGATILEFYNGTTLTGRINSPGGSGGKGGRGASNDFNYSSGGVGGDGGTINAIWPPNTNCSYFSRPAGYGKKGLIIVR